MKNMQPLDKRGYTIIESLITVIIVGVIGIVAVPRFSAVANEPARAEALTVLQHICSAADAVKAREGAYPATLEGTDWNPVSGEIYEFGYGAGTAVAKARADSATGGNAPVMEMDCTSRVAM